MEWEFTPDDVVQGHVDYGLAEFRRDMLEEFRLNLPKENAPAEPALLFAIVYDMCYWLATGRTFEEFEREVGTEPYLNGFLRMVYRHSDANVTMLGAILQRAIMDLVEGGQPLEAALEQVAVQHAQVCHGGSGMLEAAGAPKKVIWMNSAPAALAS
ncbi:hypothetical protein [Noviherbaspirillum sp. ST9]|uniref:hypothetical protein n=1 Tax=Noviherbaspirillum sp. ST9 TaxID=3401606 RepID=UPI003B58AFAE